MNTHRTIQEDQDFAFALQLQADEEARSDSISQGRHGLPADFRAPTVVVGGENASSVGWMSYFSSPAASNTNTQRPAPAGREQTYLEIEMGAPGSSGTGLRNFGSIAHPTTAPPSGAGDDHMLAWFLQRLEFEIPQETEEERREREISGEFEGKEYAAGKCKNQMLTPSAFIALADIIYFWVMCSKKGIDDSNPMVGPSSLAMVEWGAKDAALIVYRGQWWRLISPIIMHAGVIHLISNMVIQLRVGGYLNLVFGNFAFLLIYILSGIFGNICSCIFIPAGVSVGASGALLGILSAWCVWIVFRWKKIPEQCHAQRNCQLTMVVVCIVITLAMSFAEFVDWAAHLGGAVIGIVLAVVCLSRELDNANTRTTVRVCGVLLTILLFSISIWYLAVKLKPPTEYLPYYDWVGVSKAPNE
jgi:membrane associated rhomboid family serine protease